MTIWALHGFLGLPSDFESLRENFLRKCPNAIWNSVDYLKIRELSPQIPLSAWGASLNHYVQTSGSKMNVLLGYSQGGRLALQALKDDPSLWSSAILISANPGIVEHEKWARQQNDQKWAERFLTDPFSLVVKSWNSQKVFEGSQLEPERQESKFNRRQLADCLLNWSVAKQEHFKIFLSSFDRPLLYVAGSADTKYVQIGKDLHKANSKIDFELIPLSGHRVLFDQPALLAEKIHQFLAKKNS